MEVGVSRAESEGKSSEPARGEDMQARIPVGAISNPYSYKGQLLG